MTYPTAQTIIALRWRLRVLLRLVGAALLLIALVWVAASLSEHLGARLLPGNQQASLGPHSHFEMHRIDDTEVNMVINSGPGVQLFSLPWFVVPVAMLVGAAASFLLAQFAVPLLVPVPKPDCPGCGYDLSHPSGDKCPECGLRIGVSRANNSA